MAESGFADEVDAVRRAWQSGNEEEARRLVPTGLIDKIGVVGTPEQCRAKLEEYRDAGITLPIVSPRVSGPGAKESAMEVIRACAPR
ncbi:MAG: LLM class flavin-dependent oxidoreductase [Chloroflexi bacterium]|nr:LLM class flavin-dependent oxidoreductase [Chloroflexota bacterium]